MTLKHQSFLVCMTIFLAAGLTGCKTPEAKKISDIDSMQGTWNGKELGRDGQWIMVITGDKVDLDGPGSADYTGTLVLDETTNPKSARLTILECAYEPYIDEVANGIYKFENGKLFLAASEPGSNTIPTIFEGDGNIRFFELEKVQED